MESMSAAEVAATRKLIGLTLQEVADTLGVGITAVRDWERGRFVPRQSLADALLELRKEHDQAFFQLLEGAEDGLVIMLSRGPRPQGWYLALGARIIDRMPDVMLEWDDEA